MKPLNTIDIDRDISTLRLSSKKLVNLSNKELADLFQQCINQIPSICDYWVEISAKYKRISPDQAVVGEELSLIHI